MLAPKTGRIDFGPYIDPRHRAFALIDHGGPFFVVHAPSFDHAVAGEATNFKLDPRTPPDQGAVNMSSAGEPDGKASGGDTAGPALGMQEHAPSPHGDLLSAKQARAIVDKHALKQDARIWVERILRGVRTTADAGLCKYRVDLRAEAIRAKNKIAFEMLGTLGYGVYLEDHITWVISW
jgi:hypothetical protein